MWVCFAADALPDWCKELSFTCPMLFPFETRLLHFHCTAFGASRSIVWLQNQRDQNAERTRGGLMGGRLGGGLSREDFHEFRVGRIKHERVKVKQIYFRERRSFIEKELIDRMFLGISQFKIISTL